MFLVQRWSVIFFFAFNNWTFRAVSTGVLKVIRLHLIGMKYLCQCAVQNQLWLACTQFPMLCMRNLYLLWVLIGLTLDCLCNWWLAWMIRAVFNWVSWNQYQINYLTVWNHSKTKTRNKEIAWLLSTLNWKLLYFNWLWFYDTPLKIAFVFKVQLIWHWN